jgi:hypothetical protein
MGDFSFNYVRVIVSILICSALLVVFCVFVVQNYMDFDLSGYGIQQEKSGVYQRGFTLAEVTGENLQGRIFTPAHIVMFPVVDSHVEFRSEINGTRFLRIYEQMRIKHDVPLPFTNDFIWKRAYAINLQSVSNRARIFGSFNTTLSSASSPNQGWVNLADLARVPGDGAAQSMAHPRGGWYGVTNGSHDGTSDWLFYRVEQSERLLIRLAPEWGNIP